MLEDIIPYPANVPLWNPVSDWVVEYSMLAQQEKMTLESLINYPSYFIDDDGTVTRTLPLKKDDGFVEIARNNFNGNITIKICIILKDLKIYSSAHELNITDYKQIRIPRLYNFILSHLIVQYVKYLEDSHDMG